jgi:hypothetical protein
MSRSLTTANSSSGKSQSRDQPGLFARVEDQPWAEVAVVHTDVADKPHHGRPEKRTLKILTAERGIGFPYARQLIDMTRERVEVSTGKRGVDIVYAICSVAFEQAPPRMPDRGIHLLPEPENRTSKAYQPTTPEHWSTGRDRQQPGGDRYL